MERALSLNDLRRSLQERKIQNEPTVNKDGQIETSQDSAAGMQNNKTKLKPTRFWAI